MSRKNRKKNKQKRDAKCREGQEDPDPKARSLRGCAHEGIYQERGRTHRRILTEKSRSIGQPSLQCHSAQSAGSHGPGRAQHAGGYSESFSSPTTREKEVKLAQHKGKYTDYIEVESLGIRLGATNMAFKLLGAFKGAEESQEKKTVDCIIVDMPRPEWPEQTNVTPSNGNSPQKKEELENAKAPAAAIQSKIPARRIEACGLRAEPGPALLCCSGFSGAILSPCMSSTLTRNGWTQLATLRT